MLQDEGLLEEMSNFLEATSQWPELTPYLVGLPLRMLHDWLGCWLQAAPSSPLLADHWRFLCKVLMLQSGLKCTMMNELTLSAVIIALLLLW